MNKRLIISLAISLIGIFLLLLLSNIIEPKTIKINEITDKNLNEKVKIIVEVTKVRKYNDFQVLILKDSSGNITGTLNSDKKIINDTKKYIIIGKVQEYNKTLQLSINQIYSLSLT